MENQNTIPAPLGSVTLPGSLGRLPMQGTEPTGTPFVMKLAFLAFAALLAYGAAKFFAR